MAISPESLKILKLHFRRRLTDEQIAEEMNIDVKKVKTVLAWYRRHPEEVNSTTPKGMEVEMEMKEKILEMYKAGKTYEEISAATGRPVNSLQSFIWYQRKNGHPELGKRTTSNRPKTSKDGQGLTQSTVKVKLPQKGLDHSPVAQEPKETKLLVQVQEHTKDETPNKDASTVKESPSMDEISPTPQKLVQVPLNSLDPAAIHRLIDTALMMPSLKETLKHYADELETTALYIQSMAKEIREKISA